MAPTITMAQSSEIKFIQGTWKMENRESYEYWVRLSQHSFKGFSYQKRDNEIRVSEFLDLTMQGESVIYTASVIGQNDGIGVPFTLTQTDSSYVFVNPDHDFPKRISYQLLNESEIQVTVSDGAEREFSYKLVRVVAR
jgi:hypothetical protein